jgi:peptidoglycan/xylan/chitin deacetylase (PgdA/CDA1 family)
MSDMPKSQVSADYFSYPLRGRNLDHDRYAHRYLRSVPPFEWPGGKRLLVWVTVHLEHFPMDMPAKPITPPGGMDRPYPSVWDFSTRDYGNRVGIFRLMKVLDRFGIKASAAMNSEVAERYPYLTQEIVRRGWEVMAAGVDMGHLHHSQVSPEAEKALVETSFATLRRLTGQKVEGWHSPAISQSAITPELVAAAGGTFIADWINDDLPYAFRTTNGELTQLPMSWDLSDHKVLFIQNMAIRDYEQQVNAAFDMLSAESAERGGRILSLSLSPWIVAQPSRIKGLERLLSRFAAAPGVGFITAGDLAAAWKSHGPKA